MPKTKAEVVAEAHRRINVLSVDETPSDDMVAYGEAAADSLLSELINPPHDMPLYWTADAVPDGVFRPFSWLLAVDLASHYQVPAENRFAALARVRGYAFQDDRGDVRDVDADGIVTDAEASGAQRTAYY